MFFLIWYLLPFGDIWWQVEGISVLDSSFKSDNRKEQSACKVAVEETQLDEQPPAVNSNDSEASQDDKSGEGSPFVNKSTESFNVLVIHWYLNFNLFCLN